MGLFDEQSHRMIGALAYVEYPFEWAYQTLLFGRDAAVAAVDGINRANTRGHDHPWDGGWGYRIQRRQHHRPSASALPTRMLFT